MNILHVWFPIVGILLASLVLAPCLSIAGEPTESVASPATTGTGHSGPGELDLQLIKAVFQLDIAAVDKLLAMGADPNFGSNENSRPLCQVIMGRGDLFGPLPAERFELVRLLLNAGARADLTCFGMTDAFSHAFGQNARAAIQLMIEAGQRVDVESLSSLYQHLLWAAVKEQDAELLGLLLKAGVPPDFGGTSQAPPVLMQAVQYLRPEVIMQLLDAGADIHAGQYVHAAITRYDASLEVLRLLISAGARIDEPDKQGLTPLAHAVLQELPEIVSLLLSNGADPNQWDQSGVVLLERVGGSAQVKRAAIGDALLKAGADPQLLPRPPTPAYRTPFQSAIYAGDLALAKRYIEHGADVNRLGASRSFEHCMASHKQKQPQGQLVRTTFPRQVFNGCEAAQVPPLLSALHRDQVEIFSLLLANGANPDARIGDDISILEYASRRSWGEPYVDLLLEKGSFVNLVAYSGRPILDHDDHLDRPAVWSPRVEGEPILPLLTAAALGGNVSLVSKLLSHGTDPNQLATGKATPLHCLAGARPGQVRIDKTAELLLDAGAGAMHFDAEGFTPINLALQLNHLQMVRFFLTRNLDVDKADGAGRRPLALAIEYTRSKSIVGALLRMGARVHPGDIELASNAKFPSLHDLVRTAADSQSPEQFDAQP